MSSGTGSELRLQEKQGTALCGCLGRANKQLIHSQAGGASPGGGSPALCTAAVWVVGSVCCGERRLGGVGQLV